MRRKKAFAVAVSLCPEIGFNDVWTGIVRRESKTYKMFKNYKKKTSPQWKTKSKSAFITADNNKRSTTSSEFIFRVDDEFIIQNSSDCNTKKKRKTPSRGGTGKSSHALSGFVSAFVRSVMNINRRHSMSVALTLSLDDGACSKRIGWVLKRAKRARPAKQLCLLHGMICNVYYLIAYLNFIIRHHCRTPPKAPRNCLLSAS